MIAGESLDPVLVVGGARAQYLLGHRRHADDPAEEVHHLFGPRQAAEVTVNDNAESIRISGVSGDGEAERQ